MENKLISGEEGITLNEKDGATRYNNYQVLLDLLELGYSEQQAATSMQMTLTELKSLRLEFEGEDEV